MTTQMKLKQAAFLAMGLLPFALMAQTSKPSIPPAPTNKPATVSIKPQVTTAPTNLALQPPATGMPDKDKLSYAVGMYFGSSITNSIKRGELNVDTATLIEAIKAIVDGKPPRMTSKEQTEVLNQLRTAMNATMQARKLAEDQAAKVKGDAFLAQFAKSPGAISLGDGLVYKVLKEGYGPLPKDNDSLTLSYRGTLIDGTEFDHRDGFITTTKGNIIVGWQKVLPLMKVGAKWQVAIPPALAYGPRGKQRIPGNSVLVFEIELRGITPGAPLTPTTPLSHVSNTTPTPSKPNTQVAPVTPMVSQEIIKVPSADELKKGAKIEVIKGGQTNVVTPQ